MDTLKKAVAIVVAVLLVLFVAFALWANVSPTGRAVWNSWRYGVRKADNDTAYQNRRAVEEKARAQYTIYQANKTRWEQYKDSNDPDERRWAADALTMANSAAGIYNNYLRTNNYTKEMMPPDLPWELSLLR